MTGFGPMAWSPFPYGPVPSSGVASTSFVDLFNTQTVAGNKTWSGNATFSSTVFVGTTSAVAQVNIKASAAVKGALSLEAQGGSTTGLLWDINGNYGFIDYDKGSGNGVRYSALVRHRFGTNNNAAYGASAFTELLRIDTSGISPTVPVLYQSYTLATLPAVASFTRGQIWVSDMTGGPQYAYSDGVNWRRVSDLTIAS